MPLSSDQTIAIVFGVIGAVPAAVAVYQTTIYVRSKIREMRKYAQHTHHDEEAGIVMALLRSPGQALPAVAVPKHNDTEEIPEVHIGSRQNLARSSSPFDAQ
ncbi:hypothetical protein W97_07601 [Coniosporium apollinis CBS 100218]|uniref:Uncharacterized protein n=1 Tax=Coniosporium apollinis (strain CBS 100218) TaxID=1168221 RepID=R7Z2L7_CONA1|nr:uncharacterized protein W97_07601 [Coniosporium apollinis CBS 100218]EON68343.1 hypothetical protein W97_07601 [Coniosporium apollinis CBS 100218]